MCCFMATLIAHSPDPATPHLADRLASLLKDQRGVAVAVVDLARAARYVENVDAVIVVAEATEETFNHPARNFLTSQHAELDNTSVFIVALCTAPRLTITQQIDLVAFYHRVLDLFRSDA